MTGLLTAQFIRFVLVLFRISGIFVITPMLGGSRVPWRLRVLLAVAVSAAIFPLVKTASVVLPSNAAQLVLGIAGELAVGVVCGFVVNIVFVAAQMGGALISRQMGTALAQVINPMFEAQVPLFGQFYYMFALVVFMAVNGHHMLLSGLLSTFERVPLMGAQFHVGMVAKMTVLMGDMFVLMIKLAAPTFAALFLVTVVLGIIARTVPQIHVLIIGFPLKACVGFVVTAVALAGTAALLGRSFTWILQELEQVVRFMVPR